jgi:glycosyltransferase involved in cell wall biosynthesis
VKLLFVIQNSHGWAGTERVLSIIANSLSNHHEIEILSLSVKPQSEIGYQFEKRIRRIYLPVSSNIIGILASNLNIARFIDKNNYDLVILAGIGEIKHFLLTALLHRTKIAAWEHFNAAYTYKRFNRKFAARYCDAIVVLSKNDLSDWNQLLSPKAMIVQIPNPVPFFPRKISGLESKTILALGRLEQQKQFDILIDAFAIFSKTHVEWKLRIRGSGSEEEKLKLKAEYLGLTDKIQILGPTSNVEAEYLGASIYAMSSKFEGFPMTLLEAMAYGIPCVSFDCPNGPSEIINDGEDGFIVPLGDIEMLANRMSMIADNEALKYCLGKKARENIQRFDLKSITKHWDAFIQKLCA